MSNQKITVLGGQEDGIIDNLLNQLPLESKIFLDKSMEICEQIQLVLTQKNLLQKDFAKLLGKSEPEISKWMAGGHNFTLRTLSFIESVLQEDIILTKVGMNLKNKCGSASGHSYSVQIKARVNQNMDHLLWFPCATPKNEIEECEPNEAMAA